MPSVDAVIDRTIGLLPPATRLALRARRHFRRAPELRLAVALCERQKGAIDIGANRGLFSYYFARSAAWCVAFEPNAELAADIARALPHVVVHAVGAGARDGEELLRTPVVKGVPYSGHASMAGSTALSEYPHKEAAVPIRRLDAYSLRNVGFVKIDVEGYEEQVLIGAAETITRDRPALLIEIEDRHNPGGLSRVTSTLSQWGYRPPQIVSGAENNHLFLAEA